MRKIREILRLRWGLGLKGRAVARSVRVSPSTVVDCVRRAKEAGLGWPLPEHLDDGALEALLYPLPVPSGQARAVPDFVEIHREMRRHKHVTLQLLWEEYRGVHPDDGYGYSRYCELYHNWVSKLDVCLRQNYRGGERAFVDFAGQTLGIVKPETGEVSEGQLFVGVLGASNYTYSEVCGSQDLPSWIMAHIRMFEYWGGVPRILVPDNLKAGVTSPCRYEPDVNRTYADLAEHYGTAVIPARVHKPRDKAKVEGGVLIAERWILAKLRKRTFFSLAEAKEAVWELLEELNTRAFKKLPGNRRSLFLEVDKPALLPLPGRRYEMTEWCQPTVNIDYHVEVDKHYYSVPHGLRGKKVDARSTATTVELLFKGKRVASHPRSYQQGKHTTDPAHMPEAHRAHLEWTPSRLIRWAQKTGPAAAELVERIMESRRHPEQGYRACLGVMRLGNKYGTDRLEDACVRANHAAAYSYKSVKSILEKGLDRQPLEGEQLTLRTIGHDNIRGPAYYRDTETAPAPGPLPSEAPATAADVSPEKPGPATPSPGRTGDGTTATGEGHADTADTRKTP